MVLVAVSGGMDSVGLLYLLLARSGEEVHAHHIKIKEANQTIWRAQDDALELIVPWLREHCRAFAYTVSVVPSAFRHGRGDIVWVSDECGKAVKRGEIPRPDRFSVGMRHEEISAAHETASSVAGRRGRIERSGRAWRASFDESPPEFRCPSIELSRPELWEAMPEGLRILTTTCRRPVLQVGGWNACDRCFTCRELKKRKLTLKRTIKASRVEGRRR